MTTIGDVAVKLGLDSKEFIKQIDKAEDECKKLEHNLNETKESFEKMSKAMAMTKNPSKEMVNAFKNLKNELRNQQSAFNNFQGKLNKFDGGLSKSTGSLGMLQGALGKLVAGGAIIALGKQMIDFSAKSVEAYRVQDRAIKGLNTALQNAGVYTAEYSNHLQKLSSEIQSFSNYGDEAVEKAIGLGQAFSGNIKLTDDLIKATVDYAAATETDLQTAFTLVGKSIGTSTNALARYGVSLDQNMTKEEKMRVITETLAQRFNGSARDMADSSIKLKNATGDLSEAFGKLLNPSVEKTQNFLQRGVEKLTEWINKVRILHSEIQQLDYEESQTRYKQTLTQLQALDKKRSKQGFLSGPENGKYYQLVKDLTEVEGHIEEINRKQKKLAQDSKNNYVAAPTSTTSGGSKEKKQDKALEAYKKYIEEYAKLNDDYAATLQARQYVEGTLNIDPITQKEEYDKMIALYQAHLSKMAEIRRSGAKNQAEIEKLENEKLAQDLQELRLSKEQETQRKLQEIIKGYDDTAAGIDLNVGIKGVETGFFGAVNAQYKAKLDIEKWYQDERKKIIETSNNDLLIANDAFAKLDALRNAKLTQSNLTTWRDYGQALAGTMSTTFSNLLTGQQSFGDSLLNLASNMLNQMLQMVLNYVMQELAIRAASFFLGGFGGGSIGSVATGITPSILPSHHSGGMIPGTKEQVAVLQGGERVLNRSEAASYNSDDTSGNNGINNIMVFNIKAWDGRDVIDTLKANEQTINQIVSSGIKNNKQGLRTIVQNT